MARETFASQQELKHSQMWKCKVSIQLDLDLKIPFVPQIFKLWYDFLNKSSVFNLTWLLLVLWVSILKLSWTSTNKINSSKK